MKKRKKASLGYSELASHILWDRLAARIPLGADLVALKAFSAEFIASQGPPQSKEVEDWGKLADTLEQSALPKAREAGFDVGY